jgi:capsular polysaccharide biosynthesis protein
MLLELDQIRSSDQIDQSGNVRWLFLPTDKNGRSIWLHKISAVQFAGASAFYPSVFIYSDIDARLYNPIREKTMSLAGMNAEHPLEAPNPGSKTCDEPTFFFIYNTDNYYHFIYDSLPYLISYGHLKVRHPTLKLLMNYPNSQSKEFYPFVIEFLELMGISQSDIILVDMNTRYSTVFLSSSYTHDHRSEAPPREEIYPLYRDLVRKNAHKFHGKGPKKIYISRRTWLHGDYSNIGTNYTNRRRLENEDALVEMLRGHGFTEVFTEKLSTLEKLDYFSNAEIVVGALGGGVCNVLFSPIEAKLLCLVSPTFLDVNARFSYSLNRVKLSWFLHTKHVETGTFKRFMRVSCPSQGIVGEVTAVHETSLDVAYTSEIVAGWNAQNSFNSVQLEKKDCVPLDAGLNSAWLVDLNAFKSSLQGILVERKELSA